MPFAYFNRFELELSDDIAQSCSHQGRCDDDVAEALRIPAVRAALDAISADDIRAELREYGAWDCDELADDEQNRARILWCAACNIKDDPEQEEA